MTERDKLIDLITEANIKLFGSQKSFVEFIADYLLENGIIVPPVKFGDTVYKISECYLPPCFSTDDGFAVKHYICTTIFKRSDIYPKDLYFTKEEAEKALAERNGA